MSGCAEAGLETRDNMLRKIPALTEDTDIFLISAILVNSDSVVKGSFPRYGLSLSMHTFSNGNLPATAKSKGEL